MKKVLILEDNLEVLKSIFEVLKEMEFDLGRLAVTVLSEAGKADNFLKDYFNFDLILLDYYAIDGNFHQVVFNSQISTEKIIAISSVDRCNLEAKKKGALTMIQKNLANLNKFKEELREEILKILK